MSFFYFLDKYNTSFLFCKVVIFYFHDFCSESFEGFFDRNEFFFVSEFIGSKYSSYLEEWNGIFE